MRPSAEHRAHNRLRRGLFGVLKRFDPDETAILMVMAVLVGIVGGFGAMLFRWLVDVIQGFVLGKGEATVQLLGQTAWWKTWLLPVVGGLIVGPLVHLGARETRGSGVPQVLRALVLNKGVIRPVVAAVKILASAITIAFGGSLGREGPIIQIGAAMGSTLGQWFRFSPQRLRTLIGCGAAAGIAATFNAPIAGTFFALEILLKDFAVVTFSPIIVAAVTATAVSREFLGDTPAFPIPGFDFSGYVELPYFLVLGLLIGLVAVAWVRTLHTLDEAVDRSPVPRWLQPACGGLLLGGLLVWFPQLYGVGYDTMVEALGGNLGWQLMLALVALKMLAANITLGAGFSGGIFGPALFMGGMTGGAFGALIARFLPAGSDPVGGFAMVGMAAMVGAATGGPLSAILILFEMTGEYRVILPLMLASIGAALSYRSLLQDSIFTLKSSRRGEDLHLGRESALLRSFHVEDIMEVNPLSLPGDASLERILDFFLSHDRDHVYIIDGDSHLVGRISIHEVKFILHAPDLGRAVKAVDLLDEAPPAVLRDDNLETCLLQLGHQDVVDLPVIFSRDKPILIGQITRRAIFEVYNREILQHQDMGIHLVTGEARLHDCVELPEEYKVQLFTPPQAWYGRTLRQLELRPRFGVSVLAVKKGSWVGSHRNRMPDPDLPLLKGDRLIVVGEKQDLDRLLNEVNPVLRDENGPGVDTPGP